MKNLLYYSLSFLVIINTVLAETKVQIVAITGDVKVRYGLNEVWQKAALGEILKDYDTIFNGENAHSTLKLSDGSSLTLGPNSVLDISDLRIILEKEMFLYLMSKKVDKIENKNIKTELRVGNVSVIHGENAKKIKPENGTDFLKAWSLKEINGAKALYEQSYYSNSIVKLNTILARYDTLANQELIYLYLAKGFEALNKNGQAIDAYQQLITIISSHKLPSEDDKKKIEQAQLAIKNLSN